MTSKMLLLKHFYLFGFIAVFLANDVVCKKGTIWAVLHCGYDSYTFSYGMEAAVYRMYNILIKNGVPKEQIITITPDSVAYNPANPLPGIVVHSTTGNPTIAPNQYENVEIDYETKDLNADLFFEILNGNETAVKNIRGSGKVLKTGPKDNVFFYTSTLGLYGALLFSQSSVLYANTFISYLESLKDRNRFSKMFMYVDAENPASMFDDYLDASKNILVHTLGGRYTPMYMVEKNTVIGAYTSTLGSSIFLNSLERMQSPDTKNVVTIFDYFLLARNEAHFVDLDPLNLYGTLKLGKEHMSNFIGKPLHKNLNTFSQIEPAIKSRSQIVTLQDAFKNSDIISETEISTLKNKLKTIFYKSLEDSGYSEDKLEIYKRKLPFKTYDCYKSALEAALNSCFTKKNQLVLFSQSQKFVRMCAFNIESEKIVRIVREVCQ